MTQLAIHGGKPVRRKLFPAYNTIGAEEKSAVRRVMATGNLSQFLGAWHADFLGGSEVRAFEKEWAEYVGCRHAVSVNSNTSGLNAALGACGVGPGDEVIVSPYTMTASAVAPLVYGAVPVFADIEEDTFCLSLESIRACITERTKAILVVHIFGQPADMDPIMELARPRGIRVIEDCAQVPGAKYRGRSVGTIGDLGVFSLNYHKHIHTGEGGVVTTNDDALADRVRLIRNHGEAVVGPMGHEEWADIVGFNYRMTELQAAIGREQLKKLDRLNAERVANAELLAARLGRLPGLVPPVVRAGCTHVYYVQPFRFRKDVIGVHRNAFVDAIKAELPSARLRETVPLIAYGYAKPLYLQPLYQRRLLRCGFNCPRYKGQVRYEQGLCPVAERMHFEELFSHEFMRPGMSREDLDDVVAAFEKVYERRTELGSPGKD